MTVIREHLADKPLGLHSDLQTEALRGRARATHESIAERFGRSGLD